jgi:phosphatidylglycerophosphate synthase
MSDATRKMTFLTADPERRLLRAMAARMPRPIHSDHLTAIGVAGSILVGVSYALSTFNPVWLLVASLALVVNWFGDSLDGTLARVRKVERPKYGYYLDHVVDAFNTVIVGGGIGLSPYVSIEFALLLVVMYLLLSINVYIETQVYGSFKMGYGVFGPTEVRILLILANLALYAGVTMSSLTVEGIRQVANWAVVVLASMMFLLLFVRFAKNVLHFAKLEPRQKPK